MANKSFSFKLRSHPHLLLIDHLTGVVALIQQLWHRKKINWPDDAEQRLFFDLTRLAGWCHDLAKATSSFQNYIAQAEKEEPKKTRLSQHQALSALFAFYMAQKYLESQTQTHPYSRFLPIICYFWVKKHHGNLRDLFDDQGGDDELADIDSELISEQISRLVQPEFELLLNHICNDLSIEFHLAEFQTKLEELIDAIYPNGKRLYRQLRQTPDQRLYFIFQWCYSLLLTADKYHAMLGCLPQDSDLDIIQLDQLELYRQEKFQARTDFTSQLRQAVYRDCLDNAKAAPLDGHFFALNVPTGSGKTLAGLAAALMLRQRLIESGHQHPKIIYCLPFMSIIDQNFKVFFDVFNGPPSHALLKHHSLVEMAYIESHGNEYDADREALLIEGWDASIVVTTFVQLFHTMVGNQNMTVRRMHQLTGSIIILDEIQTLPYQYWALVERLFDQMAQVLDCRFILMTATLPKIISEQKLIHLVPHADRYFEQFDRYHVRVNLTPMTLEELTQHLHTHITSASRPSILIIVNTTSVARMLFQQIEQNFRPAYTVHHLSTRLTPHTRLKRIEHIKQNKNPQIVVSTQLVEAGVDLDFDVVIRDFSPLDSLNQAAGRCNREGKRSRGKVDFIMLVNDQGYPYYRYIYAKEDVLKIFSTREIVESSNELSERQFLSYIRNYYGSLKEKQGTDLADDLLTKMGQLAFAKLARFQLISEEYPSAHIFIPENQAAISIWQRYMEIQTMKASFEKRKQFLKIKPELMQYVISIPKNLIPEDWQMFGGIYYLPVEHLDKYYHKDIGFYPTEEAKISALIF